jgi:hypothetical protein
VNLNGSRLYNLREVADRLNYKISSVRDRRVRARIGLVVVRLGPTRAIRVREADLLRVIRSEPVSAGQR